MTYSMLYTRRLLKSELETWLQVGGTPTAEEAQYAKSFLQLPDSMFFIATINGIPVGGTAIYRDRTRLAMALVAARLEEEFRENMPFQLFKASLPFFKTLSIRGVDALVAESDTIGDMSFSLAPILRNWALPALRKMGFQEIAKSYRVCIEGVPPSNIQSQVTIDRTPNYDSARELLWNQRENIGLSCSHQWLALDMAKERNTIKTFSLRGETCLVVAVEKFGSGYQIPFFAANSEILACTMAAEAILHHISADRLIFSLVGTGQKATIDAIRDLYNSANTMYGDLLLRKQL
ncbi:MAG: hypothetical protein EAX95_04240 [Candidatus Thorarchaeota archaeon]|nr:hypothetical protein [Candidatus Thorarchaeota archaeon]